MSLYDFVLKKYFQVMNNLSGRSFADNIPCLRYFRDFWLHIVEKENAELRERYYSGQIIEDEAFVRLAKKFKNKNVIPFMDLCVGTKCTLNCRDCTQWLPYLKNREMFSAKRIIDDLEKLFKYVDYIHFISPLGGEPFLNPEIAEILEYLIEMSNKGKIGYIRLVTNGTIFPKDDILKCFYHQNIGILVSNYDGVLNNAAMNNKKQLIDYFKNNKLNYFSPEGFKWFDLGIYNGKYGKKKNELIDTFKTCFAHNCTGFYDGVLYRCARSYAVVNIDGIKPAGEQCIDISAIKSKKDMKSKLRKFYSLRYLDACDYCVNNNKRCQVEPAVQVESRVHNL